ncbi:hypothetical protein B0H19DRAFT_1160255, partial [Mycena capillaripes]
MRRHSGLVITHKISFGHRRSLVVYGGKIAAGTCRVATVLHELQVPFELIERARQGFILYETRAICRYIAAKYPASRLIPIAPKANALFERAGAVEITNFDPIVAIEMWTLRFLEMAPDQALVNAELEILDKKLDAYDVILAKQSPET